MKNYKSNLRTHLGFLIILFSSNNINKFILLLRKCVYPYEYMAVWEKFNEISTT